MLSGPAILRISVLLLIAGGLAALVQFLLPAPPPAPAAAVPEISAVPLAAAVPPAPAPPTPQPSAAPQPGPPRQPGPESQPSRAAKAEVPGTAGEPARRGGIMLPADALAFPPPAPPSPDRSPPPPAPSGESEVARAEESAGPRALALVDLNTASAAELNRLRGGGSIGRAIVSKRPYASVGDLLSKRVLSRAVYDRIREQVTVR